MLFLKNSILDQSDLTSDDFALDDDAQYSNDKSSYNFNKFPKNELTSSTPIFLSSEEEQGIYQALNDIKGGKIFELSMGEDIIHVLNT